MSALIRDVRYFARTLRRQPGFALTVILSLALGIGANSVMFGVARKILLDRLPVHDPAELVLLRWHAPDFYGESLNGSVSFADGASSTSFSMPMYTHLQRSQTLGSIVAFSDTNRLNVAVAGEATIARGAMVSGNYYSGLGVRAARGRTLTAADDRAGSAPVAVLNYSYWRDRLGGSDATVGSTIALNGKPFTVVGVEPPNFHGTTELGNAPHVIVPLAAQAILFGTSDALNDDSWWVSLIGRRKPGVADAQVAAEMSVLARQHVGKPIRVEALDGGRGLTWMRTALREPVLILAGAVLLVLLLACANVAGLSLARALARRREIAVRMSLGASRGTLVRQLLTESVVLSLLGGAAGIALAFWIRPLIPAILPTQGQPLDVDIPLDARVLLFTTAVAVVTGIVFGLVPALRATRVNLTPETRSTGDSPQRNRFASALTVVQIALSIVIMIGCGLFLRSLGNLTSQPTGFDPENVLVFRLDPTLNGYDGARLAQFYDRVHANVRALPGVRIASMTRSVLVSGGSQMASLVREGKPEATERQYVKLHTVGPEFLATMRIPVLLGRGITERDDEGAPKVVLISQSLARDYFPQENPIGQRIGWTKEKAADLEIVGIVRDARYDTMKDEMPATAYVPYRQQLDRIGPMSFAVRTTGDPALLASAVRGAVRRVDPNVPLIDLKTQTAQIAESLSQERAMARLSTFFGAMALVLSCIGLYGLMSFIGAGRTRETGVRIALGARGRDIAADVLRRSLLLVTIGVVGGVGAALMLTRFVRSMVFGVEPNDPLTIAGSVAAMVIVAIAATWIPARRASRVDPIVALRAE